MVIPVAAVTAGAPPAIVPGVTSPVPARTTRTASSDQSADAVRPDRTVRSWPLLVLAAPAAAEV
jgi:hypothetical protein